MVTRRLEGEPLAYITGRRAFWNIELHVGPGVLVPRPDSEVLIASAIEHFEGTPGPRKVLDLGTGPGTLLLAALDVWPESTGLGIDVSRSALAYASANARRLEFEARLKLAPLPFVVRWDFGVLAFSDVGRVFLHGTHSEIWHAGVGGGVFALLPDRSALLYLTLAHADNTWALDAGTRFTY